MPVVAHGAVHPTEAMLALADTEQADAIVQSGAVVGTRFRGATGADVGLVAQARAVDTLAVLAAVFGAELEVARLAPVSRLAFTDLDSIAHPTAVAVVLA